jgi:uncharacterized membrane protein YbaN (DUF454 family)
LTTLRAQPNQASVSAVHTTARARSGDRDRDPVTRAVFATIGVLAVALGMLGAVVPGLPTTVFILIAIWAFAKCSDTLDRVLIQRNPVLRPFLKYLRPGAVMPLRAKIISLVMMWGASLLSVVILIDRVQQTGVWAWIIPACVLAAAAGGTVAIMCLGRQSAQSAEPDLYRTNQ